MSNDGILQLMNSTNQSQKPKTSKPAQVQPVKKSVQQQVVKPAKQEVALPSTQLLSIKPSGVELANQAKAMVSFASANPSHPVAAVLHAFATKGGVRGVSKKYGKHVANYLRRFSPWLRSIGNPFSTRSVQIPDPVTTPSGTFTMMKKFQLIANNAGVCALALGIATEGYPDQMRGSLIPISWSDGSSDYAIGMISPSDADEAHLFGVTSGAAPIQVTFPQWSGAVLQFYNQTRLVSAGARIVFTGNYTNAQGTITFVSATRDWIRNLSEVTSGGLSLTILQSHPDAVVLSIPRDFGGQVIYKPLDTVSLQYSKTDIQLGASDSVPDSYKGGEMYIACVGVPEGQAFQVELCFNYEAIPRTNQLDLVNATTSKSDMVSHETTWNALPELPTAAPIGVKGSGAEVKLPKMDMPEEGKVINEPIHPATEKTMIEQLFDSMPGWIDTAKKIGGELGPLIASII